MRRLSPSTVAMVTCGLLTLAVGSRVNALAQERPIVQGPPATFRSGITLREIDLTVVGKDGRQVTDLGPADFVVTEDGVSRRIENLSYASIPFEAPVTLPQDDAPPTDVKANQQPGGRIYLFLIDTFHLSAGDSLRARMVARLFIERHFGATDLGAVVYTRGRRQAMHDFTSDRRRLIAAVDQIIGERGAGGAVPNSFSQTRYYRELATFMGSVPGRRKAIVLISSGTPFGLKNGDGIPSAPEEGTLLDAARQANVAFYPIDPRGLDPDLIASGDPDAGNLRALATNTGGRAIVSTNNFDDNMARIVEENSGFYLLAYRTSDETRNGRHRIRVRVTRPGVTVRARYADYRGTGAAAALTPAVTDTGGPAAAALASPVATSGVPMRLFAAVYRGAAGRADVVLTTDIDTSVIPLTTRADGTAAESLMFRTVATDWRSTIFPGARQMIDMKRSAGVPTMGTGRVRVLSGLALPPGRYQIRAAVGRVGDQSAAMSGSVVYDLDVPDFEAERLALSSLAIATTRADAVSTLGSAPRLAGCPGSLTMLRDFAASDVLTVCAELYRTVKDVVPVQARARLHDRMGRVVRESAETVTLTGMHRLSLALPLDGLASGDYVLRVDARADGVDSDAPVAREIPLRIHP